MLVAAADDLVEVGLLVLGEAAQAQVVDWGLAPPKDQERRDLLEVLEDRCGDRSTLLTSQVPTTKWHDYIGDPTVADAVCDRSSTTPTTSC